jgi:hypothetical protein
MKGTCCAEQITLQDFVAWSAEMLPQSETVVGQGPDCRYAGHCSAAVHKKRVIKMARPGSAWHPHDADDGAL